MAINSSLAPRLADTIPIAGKLQNTKMIVTELGNVEVDEIEIQARCIDVAVYNSSMATIEVVDAAFACWKSHN